MPRIGSIRAGVVRPEIPGPPDVPPVENGVNLFVDAVGGSDANSGLTAALAKQTTAGMLATTPDPGTIIYFKRGQKHGPFTTFADNCEFRDYGDPGDHLPWICSMQEILGVAGDWVEVNSSGVATPGTFKWQTDLTARGLEVSGSGSFRNRVIVNDGGWLPTDYQLERGMSGSISFIVGEKNWRAAIPQSGAEKVIIYSDNPDTPGLDNPALRWTSILVGKATACITVNHPGTILRKFRCSGGTTVIFINAACTTYDCQFDNGGVANMNLTAAVSQTHYRTKSYRSGCVNNAGTSCVKTTFPAGVTDPVTVTFWDADLAQASEDCYLSQGTGTLVDINFFSTYLGATMVGGAGDGENAFDIKSGNITLQGVIAHATGGEYQPLTIQGSTQRVTLDQCYLSALQVNSPRSAINGQERENYYRVSRSLFYSVAANNCCSFGQSGGGTAQNKSIFEGNIFYGNGGNDVASVLSTEAHQFTWRHNLIIGRVGGGEVALGMAQSPTGATAQGIALLKHDGVDHGGYYNAVIYTRDLTLGAAWADTHSLTIALAGVGSGPTSSSAGWNGTWPIDTVGQVGAYYYATFKLTITTGQPTVPAFNNVNNIPTFSINGVIQPMARVGTYSAIECLATTGGFQTIRYYNNVNDSVPPLGGYAFVAGAPAGFEALNGRHLVVALYMIAAGENEYFDILLPAASQVNGGAATVIDPTTVTICFPATINGMDGNMFISDVGSTRSNINVDLQSNITVPFGANYYHPRDRDAPMRLADGGTNYISYTSTEMSNGTVYGLTGGKIGDNADDEFEVAAFNSNPSFSITSITVNALARLATIELAGHGLTVGHPVLFESQGTILLRGGRPVHSVIDVNHFTVRIPYELAEVGNFTEATPGVFRNFKLPASSKAIGSCPVYTFELLTLTDIAGGLIPGSGRDFGPMP